MVLPSLTGTSCWVISHQEALEDASVAMPSLLLMLFLFVILTM